MVTLYVVHGWTYSLSSWERFVEEAKQRSIRAVLLKVPGLTEQTTHPWTMEQYVQWLADTLPQSSVFLLGHSNGGRISLAFAARYPKRVKGLILLSSAGIPQTDIWYRLRKRVFYLLAKWGGVITKNRLIRKLLYRVIGEYDYHQAPVHMRETMRHMLAHDSVADCLAVRIPTLCIWSDHDRATPVEGGYVMRRLIAGSALTVYPFGGHLLHKTHPEVLIERIQRALAEWRDR
jgi:pimeloyl-ACP methyl ester carboxylesterase